MYNHSMGCHESHFVGINVFFFFFFFSLFSGSDDFMFEGSASHMGPLYWFPDKCCLIPGQEPAASPSFLHTTFKEKKKREISILCAVLQKQMHGFQGDWEKAKDGCKDKTNSTRMSSNSK